MSETRFSFGGLIGPEVLVVGTAGMEPDLVVESFAPPDVHTSQPWAPRPCRCGQIHLPCAHVDLVVLVGRRQPGVHMDPSAASVAIVPQETDAPFPGIPVITVPPDERGGFGPFSARVIEHLVVPLKVPGLIGIKFADVCAVLSSGLRLRYLDESGGKALVDLAPRLIARRWWTGKTDAPKAMLVGATGPTDLTLSDLNEAFEEILNVVSDETTVMFYATIDEGLKVGTGGHLRLLGTLD